jgi:hypothetical protein
MSISIPDFTNLALPFSLYNAESNRERGQHDKNEIVCWNRYIEYGHYYSGGMYHASVDSFSSPGSCSIAYTSSNARTHISQYTSIREAANNFA